MVRLGHRSPRTLAARGAPVVLVAALLTGVVWAIQAGPPAERPNPSEPSAVARQSDGTSVTVAPAPMPSGPPPDPIPTPDAAQAVLVADGWTFRAMGDADLSVVLPLGWTSVLAGDEWAVDRTSFTRLAVDHDPYEAFVDASLASIESGDLNLAAIDTAPEALSSGGGAVLDALRWPTASKTADVVDDLKRNAPHSTDPQSFASREAALASGPAINLTFRYVSPRTGKPAIGISWLVRTPRGGFLLRFRADASAAAGLDALAEAVAGSLRVLLGRRQDLAFDIWTLDPIAIVIDASDRVPPAWLEAQKQAAIDFLDELSSGEVLVVVASGGATPRVIVPMTAVYERGPVARAIRAIELAGEPDVGAAVKVAETELEKQPFGGRQIVVLATTEHGLDGETIRASLENPDHSRDADLRSISLGRGPQEKELYVLAGGKYADGAYAVAPQPADLGRALTQVRRTWDLGGLPIAGGRLDASGRATIVVPARDSPDQARPGRFVLETPSWLVSPVLAGPGGQRIALDTPQPDAHVIEGEARTTIVLPDPSPGDWTIEGVPAAGVGAAGVAFHAEVHGARLFSGIFRAQSDFGSGGPFQVAVPVGALTETGADEPLDALEAELTVENPSGTSTHQPFDRTGGQDLGISAGTVTGTTVYTTRLAGSYRLIADLRGKEVDAAFTVHHETWIYLAQSADRDHDGLGDTFEKQAGLDPADPTDAQSDEDRDGLPLAHELLDLGTSPWRFDSDGGRESDGSEVAAGRDPLDPADDVVAKSCLETFKPSPTPQPAGTPTPPPTGPPDKALEAQLPARILDRPTRKLSIVGHPDIDPFLGGIARVMAACLGGGDADVTLGYAISGELDNWGVVAIKVRGHSGVELEDVMLHRMQPGQEDSLSLHEEHVEGRAYWRSGNGWALYTAGDTLYWILAYNFGDRFSTPPPIPPADDIIDDIVRQLPSP